MTDTSRLKLSSTVDTEIVTDERATSESSSTDATAPAQAGWSASGAGASGSGTGPGRRNDQGDLEPGTLLGERYRVQRRLGGGGMGDVYLAEHVTIAKPVAVKVLNAGLAHRPELVERFLLEARSASMVRHGNIVDITDFGHLDDGTPYFVMEYMEGEDLRAKLTREGRLTWAEAKPLVLQILNAVAAAHDAGIIHRDMKPDNCFCLARTGEDGERMPDLVKVMDFGIAKVVTEGQDQDLTQTGVVIGTASYMSPEQAQSMSLDPRTDLYSVGVILYQMLTGTVPFKAGGFMGVLSKHITEAPEPVRARCPEADVSDGLEAVVMRTLAKDPSQRPASARELAGLLREQPDDQAGLAAAARSAVGPPLGVKIGLALLGLAVLGGVGMLVAPMVGGAADPDDRGAASMSGDGGMDDGDGPLAAAAPASDVDERFAPAGAQDPSTLVAVKDDDPAAEEGPAASLGSADHDAEEDRATARSVDEEVDMPQPTPRPAPGSKSESGKRRKSSDGKRRTPRPTSKPSASGATDPLAGTAKDDGLFSRQMHPAISKLKGVAVVCGNRHGGLPGVKAKVRLRVDAAGKVTATVAKPFSGTPLGKCIEQAMNEYDMGRGAPAIASVSVPVTR